MMTTNEDTEAIETRANKTGQQREHAHTHQRHENFEEEEAELEPEAQQGQTSSKQMDNFRLLVECGESKLMRRKREIEMQNELDEKQHNYEHHKRLSATQPKICWPVQPEERTETIKQMKKPEEDKISFKQNGLENHINQTQYSATGGKINEHSAQFILKMRDWPRELDVNQSEKLENGQSSKKSKKPTIEEQEEEEDTNGSERDEGTTPTNKLIQELRERDKQALGLGSSYRQKAPRLRRQKAEVENEPEEWNKNENGNGNETTNQPKKDESHSIQPSEQRKSDCIDAKSPGREKGIQLGLCKLISKCNLVQLSPSRDIQKHSNKPDQCNEKRRLSSYMLPIVLDEAAARDGSWSTTSDEDDEGQNDDGDEEEIELGIEDYIEEVETEQEEAEEDDARRHEQNQARNQIRRASECSNDSSRSFQCSARINCVGTTRNECQPRAHMVECGRLRASASSPCSLNTPIEEPDGQARPCNLSAKLNDRRATVIASHIHRSSLLRRPRDENGRHKQRHSIINLLAGSQGTQLVNRIFSSSHHSSSSNGGKHKQRPSLISEWNLIGVRNRTVSNGPKNTPSSSQSNQFCPSIGLPIPSSKQRRGCTKENQTFATSYQYDPLIPESGFKIVVMGTSGSGKTSIIQRFLYDSFNTSHLPTVEDTYFVEFPFRKNHINISISDTSGEYNITSFKD